MGVGGGMKVAAADEGLDGAPPPPPPPPPPTPSPQDLALRGGAAWSDGRSVSRAGFSELLRDALERDAGDAASLRVLWAILASFGYSYSAEARGSEAPAGAHSLRLLPHAAPAPEAHARHILSRPEGLFEAPQARAPGGPRPSAAAAVGPFPGEPAALAAAAKGTGVGFLAGLFVRHAAAPEPGAPPVLSMEAVDAIFRGTRR